MISDDETGKSPQLHQSVLLNEVVDFLEPHSSGIYVDGTLGLGGHTKAILDISNPDGRVIGLEWDPEAIERANQRLAAYGNRFQIIRTNYADIEKVLAAENINEIDGLVIDLGVSSLQLDNGERGFSFRFNKPLDMRMDDRTITTAADLINELGEEELADVFYHYGEERQSRRIAAQIVEKRNECPILTTGQLADVVAGAIPKKFHPRKIHVATKVFQALRIAVNRELDNLAKILDCAPTVLKTGARFCIITFHSLEDRMVKKTFAEHPGYKVITKRPVVPGLQEISMNPRSRSAKLRVAAAH